MSLAAAATVTGAALTADAMTDSAKQAGTSVQKTTPPDYIAGEYSALANQIKDIRQKGLLEDIQTLSPYERSLVERGMGIAAGPDPFQAAGERAVSQLLGGGGLLGEAANIYRDIGAADSGIGSPAFETATQRAVERSLRPITSQYARGGRLGSGLMGTAIGETAAQTVGDIMAQAAQQDIENRMRAASGLGGLAGQRTSDIGAGITGAAAVGDMPFTNIQRGLGLGGLLSGEEYALRQAPVTAAQRLSDIVRASTVGSNVSQPLYAPQTGNAFMGAALMQSAPQIGEAFGSLAQGIGNYFNKPTPSPIAAGSTGSRSVFDNPMGSFTPAGSPTGGGNLVY
ncbi:MAG: hypothetical protein Unbinned3459contig1002_53 [Prokaryotic dsDNA virus sp.]|jgi:hypothetical protein|nr:MAG: hypothetical protein Unbinned3459contig1002_53 [Prokaryotic dsDNA virus sp.]|tara:strand:+ start:11199 stop:12221 length:1023 start_codon:yes stop_codon:yes gene_type:complete